MTFESVEAAIQYVNETTFPDTSLALQVSDRVTFAGQPDILGAGMAILLDAVLAKGFTPDGFEERTGHRIYRYIRV